MGLGFSLAGGVDQNKSITVRTRELKKSHTLVFSLQMLHSHACHLHPAALSQVHKVFPSGVAAQEGSIKEGQQVLSINGSSLSDNLHWEALRVLRRAKTRNMGVVVLRRGGTFSTPKDREQKRSAGTTPAQSGETGQRSPQRIYLIMDYAVVANTEASEIPVSFVELAIDIKISSEAFFNWLLL